MKKIMIIEDIVNFTDEIQQKIKKFEYFIYNSAVEFINESESANNKKYLKNGKYDYDAFMDFIGSIDLFILDFDLGGGFNILNSEILEIICEYRKKSSKMVSISFYDSDFLIKRCEEHRIK